MSVEVGIGYDAAMRLAIEHADLVKGGTYPNPPVGAVILDRDGRIAGAGGTEPAGRAHAEVVALRAAGATVGNHRLVDCELFVTIEPCAMCAGAMVHARIRRLIYGADDAKAGAVRSVMQLLEHPAMNHRVDVSSGVLAGRCAGVLQAFFRERR